MKKLLIAAGLMLAFSNAQAVLSVDTTDSALGVIPGGMQTNEFLDGLGLDELFGCFGCDLYTETDVSLWIDFYGSEALFNNSFVIDGETAYSTGGKTHEANNTFEFDDWGNPVSLDDVHVDIWADGKTFLPFLFSTSGNDADAVNGSNPLNIAGVPNFFLAIGCLGGVRDGEVQAMTLDEEYYDPCASTYWLFFDDGTAEEGDDDNHDDLVVRIRAKEIVKVPEAGSLALLGLGLVGLGFARRRV